MAKRGLIGVQMSTVKEKVGTLGAYGTLSACAELGYHCVEVSQIPMTAENVAGLGAASREFGVKIAALSAPLEPEPGRTGETLATDFDKIVDDCKTLDCDLLRLGILPKPCMGTREAALGFARRADEMALRLKERGIDLYYHNHHVEFTRFDGEYLLDLIRDNTRRMGFELDIHWIQRGGENPVNVINRFAGRIRLLHLKDYRIAPYLTAETAAALGVRPSPSFENIIEFAEIGEGSLPIKACIEAGLAGGSEYFLVEQDATYGRDPFESLRISRENLIKLGYGDWFSL